MVKLNQILQVEIQSLEENGYGSCNIQKDKVFVKGILPKEKVKIKVNKKIKDGYVAEVLEVLAKDQGRTKSKCGIYQRCGSCHLLHCNYDRQLQIKQEQLAQAVKKAGLHEIQVHPVQGMKEPYAYRNKIIVGFSRDKQRNIQAGFYEEFSHNIIPFQHCLLHDDVCDAIIQTIVKLMKKLHVDPYQEDRKTGLLRHVLIRKGVVSKQIMVVLVVANAKFPGSKNFVSALLKEHPEITTVIQNVNNRKTSVVLGDEERVLYGKGFISDTLCGYKFQISAKSFYQINHDQCEVLYEKALSLCAFDGKETLLDAYCGIGTIGMVASKQVKQVVGVELNKQAVRDAIYNAKQNNVKNVRFIAEDASAYMEKAAMHKDHIDVIIMDPPRSGSTPQFMNACAKLNPKEILYISCDPLTQIRDVLYFQKLGYKTKDMYLVDMFPNTMHVESILKLVRTKIVLNSSGK